MNQITIGLIVVGAIIAYFIFMKVKTPPTDLNDIDQVLNEVEVHMAYGQSKEAIAVLENALRHHGVNSKLTAKLNEIRNSNS